MTLTCQRCGGDLPLPDEETQKLLQRAGVVELGHAPGQCPNELQQAQQAAQGQRYFEARVSIVEVKPIMELMYDAGQDGPVGELDSGEVEVIEHFSFKPSIAARDLDSAMRPLALQLGERWQEAERAAKIADS